MTTKIDLLRRANRNKGGKFLRPDIAASAVMVHGDSYALSAAQLRWHRLIIWLLVSAVILWDIAKTFGH